MPRRLRVASGGYAYHVLNRAVGRMRIFGKQRDFEREKGSELFNLDAGIGVATADWFRPAGWHCRKGPRVCGTGFASAVAVLTLGREV